MKKLNLGCGRKYKKGWVNVDISEKDIYGKKIKIDLKHDLNKFPYPFQEGEFDIILIEHVLEHLKNPFKVIKELKRITCSGGIIKIIVPHFSCYLAYRDPTHRLHSSIDTIYYLKGDAIVLCKKLKASYNKLINLISFIINLSPRVYERFFYGFFPVQECIWILKVK